MPPPGPHRCAGNLRQGRSPIPRKPKQPQSNLTQEINSFAMKSAVPIRRCNAFGCSVSTQSSALWSTSLPTNCAPQASSTRTRWFSGNPALRASFAMSASRCLRQASKPSPRPSAGCPKSNSPCSNSPSPLRPQPRAAPAPPARPAPSGPPRGPDPGTLGSRPGGMVCPAAQGNA